MTDPGRHGTTRPRTARLAAGAACVLVVALAGCTSSSGGASATSASAASTPPTATATVTAPAPPAATTTTNPSTAAGATSNCTDAQLRTSTKPLSGATSHSGLLLVFTNRSTRTCTLHGYPGVADVDSSGKQIVQARRTLQGFLGSCRCSSPPHVLLHPGDTASGVVEGTTGGGDECLRGRSLLVTAPNTTRSVSEPFDAYSCDLQVHPVIAGATARLPG